MSSDLQLSKSITFAALVDWKLHWISISVREVESGAVAFRAGLPEHCRILDMGKSADIAAAIRERVREWTAQLQGAAASFQRLCWETATMIDFDVSVGDVAPLVKDTPMGVSLRAAMNTAQLRLKELWLYQAELDIEHELRSTALVDC
jgi:hypothetical protein